MSHPLHEPQPLRHMTSGIKGLDRILNDGFIRGDNYLIVGTPGTGKTTLANQIAFHHAGGGGRVLYVTMLAESTTRMLVHLQRYHFFDAAIIGDAVYYINGYPILQRDGLDGLLALLQREVRQKRISLLVIDGLMTIEPFVPSNFAFTQFLHNMQVTMATFNCTTLLLGPNRLDRMDTPPYTTVDGLIVLSSQVLDQRTIRDVEVLKSRGSPYLPGHHVFTIGDEGIEVYPQVEALGGRLAGAAPEEVQRLSFGVPALDEMLEGGLLAGSSSLILGTSGSGKTVLGLQFLASGAQAQEPALLFGFNEQPAMLVRVGDRLGLGYSELVAEERLVIEWQPCTGGFLDILVAGLLELVEQRSVKRLFIDSLAGFNYALPRERLLPCLTRLISELQERGVTTLFSAGIRGPLNPLALETDDDLAMLFDNLLLLSHVEMESRLYRLLSILKARYCNHDPTIREFQINDGGLGVGQRFENVEGILSGSARQIIASAGGAAQGGAGEGDQTPS